MIQTPFKLDKPYIIVPALTSQVVEQIGSVINYGITIKKLTIQIYFNPISCTEITLWEGVDYDNIGNWIDDDVEKRLLQILNK